MRSTALLMMLLAGCSLAIDTDQYRGGGTTDAGDDDDDDATDADTPDADANAPSTPAIALTPEVATAASGLYVEITTESVDPLGESVTYEYAWTVNRSAISDTTSSISPMRAKKGEVWAVSVTPVAGDRRGVPATAMVTIVNSAPELDTISLSAYDLIKGETVTAYPAAHDADGDELTLTYRWLAADAEVGTEASLVGVISLVDAEIYVEATASDGEATSPTVRVGPIGFTAESVVRWRQISPDRTSERGFPWSFDPQHRRVLFVSTDGSVWEHDVDRADARLVRLSPGGARPGRFGGGAAAYDPHNKRLIVARVPTAGTAAGLFALDLANRGSETWAPLPVPPELEGAALASMTFDYEMPHAYLVVSTFDPSGSSTSGSKIVKIDFTDPAVPTFETLGVELPNLVAPGIAKVVGERRLYLIGGGPLGDGGPMPTNSLLEIDLDAVTAMPAMVGPLPAPQFAPFVAVEQLSGRIYYGLGISNKLYELDPDTDASTELRTTGASPTFGGLGMGAFDPRTHDLLVVPGFTMLGGMDGRIVYSLYRAVGDGPLTFSKVDVYGETTPPALASPVVGYDPAGMPPTMFLFFGETDRGNASSTGWAYNTMTNRWSTVAPDGLPPAARFGNSYEMEGPPRFAGGQNPGGLVDDGAWLIAADGRWTQVYMRDSQLRRTGAVVFNGCGVRSLRMFGGTTATDLESPSANDDLVAVDCPSSLCNVTTINGANLPAARAYAAMSTTSGDNMLLFGGADGSTRFNDLHGLNRCTGDWSPRSYASGARPAGRMGHSLTRVRGGAEIHLLFGGRVAAGNDENAVWTFTKVSGADTYTAARLDPRGETPLPRSFHVAVWDEPHHRMLIYGGRARYGDEEDRAMSDLWELHYR